MNEAEQLQEVISKLATALELTQGILTNLTERIIRLEGEVYGNSQGSQTITAGTESSHAD